MRFAIKLSIASSGILISALVFYFLVFPKVIHDKIATMTAVIPGNDIRELFTKVPFGLDFKVYMFNVTNPMDVQKGELPIVHQVGPFCYQEWKEKIDISDDEESDTMLYKSKDTFFAKPDLAKDCLTGDEMVTIVHPFITGMVNAVKRTKPAMLNMLNKALMAIFRNPESIYLTAKAKDILFDGIIINCDVKEFAAKAVCTQLRTEAPDLKHVSETELSFAIMAPKNGTPSKIFKVLRGKKDSRDLGRILEYNDKKEMEAWPTEECNQIKGTDGTIFPPFLDKKDGLVSYAPDLCRSLGAVYEEKTSYDGIPVRSYTATLGDMSKNADEKCYCYTNDTCLKKGMMDLFKCVGVPIYVSLPHFYESDPDYLKGVKGLNPNKKEHGITILFESMTGGPVSARKRLQFNVPLERNEKIAIFKNIPEIVHPLFWVEEGVSLNNTFTKPIKDLFKIMKIVKIAKWVILLGSLGGLAGAAYLFMKKSGGVEITPVHKVKPAEFDSKMSGISRVNGFEGSVNHAMSDNEIDKY